MPKPRSRWYRSRSRSGSSSESSSSSRSNSGSPPDESSTRPKTSSHSRSRSSSRSKSGSSSGSKSPPKSRSQSRSRAKSRSKSPPRSRSKSRSKSPPISRSQSRSKSPPSSRSRSRSKSQTTSRSRSRSKSQTTSRKRSRSSSDSSSSSSSSSESGSRSRYKRHKRTRHRISRDLSKHPGPIHVTLGPPEAYEAGPSKPYEGQAPWRVSVEYLVSRSPQKSSKGSSKTSSTTPPPSGSKTPPKKTSGSYVATGLTRGSSKSPPLKHPIIPIRDKHPDEDFEFKEKKGKGSFSTVWIVKDKRHNNREVVLKKLKDQTTENQMKHAQREYIIMSRMNNENVCNLIEAYRWSKTNVHFLLEPCKGDLFDYIRDILCKLNREQKLGEIKHIAIGILNGVEYMHGKAVLHRDLKTENILMKEGGAIKICDFGLSRKIEAKDPIGERTRHYSKGMGTLEFTSPEVLLLQSDYGFESDMWSIACIIGEMFKGDTVIICEPKPTWPHEKIPQLNAIQALCGDIPLPPGTVPPDLTRGNWRRVNEHFLPFTEGDAYALDLLNKAFELDPTKRLTPREMRGEDFFQKDPEPLRSWTAH